jgi:hypothetical protein
MDALEQGNFATEHAAVQRPSKLATAVVPIFNVGPRFKVVKPWQY